jgi:hypothetical protein
MGKVKIFSGASRKNFETQARTMTSCCDDRTAARDFITGIILSGKPRIFLTKKLVKAVVFLVNRKELQNNFM